MYADKESRGGILEPPGICEVKFRAQDQVSAMHRCVGTLSFWVVGWLACLLGLGATCKCVCVCVCMTTT